MATSSRSLRAIDRLKKAANLDATKKEVELSDGTIFELWVTPLTMAEREIAQKGAKSDDANEFALRLLLTKAQDEVADLQGLLVKEYGTYDVNLNDGTINWPEVSPNGVDKSNEDEK